MKTCTFLASYDSYIDNPDIDIAGLLKKDGFDGGEPDHYSFVRRKEDPVEGSKKLRARFDEEGLTIPCYSRGMTLLDRPREEAVKLLCAAVDICEILGSPILHHTLQTTFHSPNIPIWQKHVDYMAEICREVAYYAGEKGISCIYEDQGYFVNTPDRLGEILAKIDMPNTGICLDLGNALFNEIDPIDFASMLAPFIRHLHVKDYLRKPLDKVTPNNGWMRTANNNMLRATIIGHGVIDFESIFSLLILSGYKGYFSIENGGIEYNNTKSIATSLSNMKYFYDKSKNKLVEMGYIKEN